MLGNYELYHVLNFYRNTTWYDIARTFNVNWPSQLFYDTDTARSLLRRVLTKQARLV